MYKNIKNCKDGQYLIDNLNTDSLNIIENILAAYNSDNIGFLEPRDEDGKFNPYGEFELVINCNSYIKTGMEILVLKWYEDYEDTEYLVECFS